MLSHGVFVCCVSEISKCIRRTILKSIVLMFKKLFVLVYFYLLL